MKHFFTLTVIAALATASVITLSAFNSKKSTTATEYQITCASKTQVIMVPYKTLAIGVCR
jgi:hypothetical protein